MRALYLLALTILLLPLTVASQADLYYSIQGRDAVVTLSLTLQESLTITFPESLTDITINQEVAGDSIELPAGQHTITYRAEGVVDGNHIVIDLTGLPVRLGQVTVELAPEMRLQRPLSGPEPSIYPRPSRTATDGERLLFVWEGAALEPSRAILIIYKRSDQTLLAILIGVLLVASVIAATKFALKSRKSTALTTNLLEEEKQLVELLERKGELWQSELVRQSGLSKVRVSRKLRSLEAKGVVERIPYGNSNKVRLKQ
jgi:uncharacterized membrane protein